MMTGTFAPRQRLAEPAVPPNETVLWSAYAPRGPRVGREVLSALPLTLVFCAFAIFWETSVIASGAPLLFRLSGLPFVAAGAYALVGRFAVDAYLRARTVYAVTDRAAYVIRTSRLGRVQRYAGSALDAISFEVQPDGTGTIRFVPQPAEPRAARGVEVADAGRVDVFMEIGDVRRVYALPVDAAHEARRSRP